MDAAKFMFTERLRSRKSAAEQSHAALERLRAMTGRADERLRATTTRTDVPLHPVSAQVIGSCLTLIELCWAVRSDESRDDIVDRMKRMADVMRAQAETLRSTHTEQTR
jgi:hypothetical protein